MLLSRIRVPDLSLDIKENKERHKKCTQHLAGSLFLSLIYFEKQNHSFYFTHNPFPIPGKDNSECQNKPAFRKINIEVSPLLCSILTNVYLL